MPEWDRLHKLAFELETEEMLRICGVDAAGRRVEALPTDYRNDIRSDCIYLVGDAVVHIEVQASTMSISNGGSFTTGP
jgi:hypothetical protein